MKSGGKKKAFTALRIGRSEAARLARLLQIERELQRTGANRVAGADEAGRGPLAGPVCAAVVIFRPGTRIAGVDDSKRLPADVRESLYEVITSQAEAVGVGLADAAEIDVINILNATKLAFRRALRQLLVIPDHLLLDALKLENCTIPQTAYVQGDSRCFSIAAASIIAKVTRDRLMARYALEYPQYGFEQHKGYSTELHLRNIFEHGISSLHRRSFFDPGFLSPGFCRSQAHCRIARMIAEAECDRSASVALQEICSMRGFLPQSELEELNGLLTGKCRELQILAERENL